MPDQICVRVIHFSVPADRLDECLAVMREEIAEYYHTIPSYRGAMVFGDRGTGQIISKSLWTNDGSHRRLSPNDLLAYFRNRHGIDAEVLSAEEFEVLFWDRVPIPEAVG